ncbi:MULTISPECIES: hypothetical protein [Sorangium]|uniref:Uncharacterized protein n=1 Tax=Sorangium cellulosum TaxID=56 RepID=A0A4P2R3Q2_SORCE|nr:MULTISPECIES: hypothetical protein [Sorangium]AUX37677.1 uncharacterized protein SOCE836_099070 [Sorangium cellulosum]WCQ96966.1 hypothetical protein NQZ70_09756 [Sorangium sp. Soce836]
MPSLPVVKPRSGAGQGGPMTLATGGRMTLATTGHATWRVASRRRSLKPRKELRRPSHAVPAYLAHGKEACVVSQTGRDLGVRALLLVTEAEVLASMSLDHVEHLDPVLRRLAEHLVPHGRLIVTTEHPLRAAVIESKLTEDSRYILQGFHEAIVYRWEYAGYLRGWPMAILVTSADVAGAVRLADDVIAVGWTKWAPEAVVKGLLEGPLSTKCSC